MRVRIMFWNIRLINLILTAVMLVLQATKFDCDISIHTSKLIFQTEFKAKYSTDKLVT